MLIYYARDSQFHMKFEDTPFSRKFPDLGGSLQASFLDI